MPLTHVYHKTKKHLAMLIIAIFLFETVGSLSLWQSPAQAKQLIVASPSSFYSSWNNGSAVTNRELKEDAGLIAFTSENAAFPRTNQITDTEQTEETTIDTETATTAPPTDATTTPAEATTSTAPIVEPSASSSTPATTTISSRISSTLIAWLGSLLPGAVYAKPDQTASSTQETPDSSQTTEQVTTPSTSTVDTPKQTDKKPENVSPQKATTTLDTPVASTTPSTPAPVTPSTTAPIQVETPTSTISETQAASSTQSNTVSSTADNVSENIVQDSGKMIERSYLIGANFLITNNVIIQNRHEPLKNPHLALSFANEEIPGHEIVISYDDNATWKKIVTLKLDVARSNKSNNGYFYYSLPFNITPESLSSTQIRLTHIGPRELNKKELVFVDAMWIEAEYEPTDAATTQTVNSNVHLVSQKKDFLLGDDLDFQFTYQKPQNLLDTLTSMFTNLLSDTAQAAANYSVQVAIADTEGIIQSDLEPSVSYEPDGTFAVQLKKEKRVLRPGKYRLQVTVYTEDGTETYDQLFTWGVLAINTNKSIYTPGETAALHMAALREDGHAICDAQLTLVITAPSGSASSPAITPSPACGPNNVIDVPDYSAEFVVSDIGTHTMTLTNVDTNHSVTSTFDVADTVPFDIRRTGPTRIYPLAPYDVSIFVTPHTDFNGTFTEQVPEDFLISNISLTPTDTSFTGASEAPAVQNVGGKKTISAQVAWKSGETYELRYQFDAPDVSPYLFLLGPAYLASNDLVLAGTKPATSTTSLFSDQTAFFVGTFSETRQWQIASDAIGIIDPNGDGTVQCSVNPAGSHFAAVDDATREPGTPDTGDYVQCDNAQSDVLTMSTLTDVETVTQIQVYAYYQNVNSEMQWEIELWDNAETTQYGTTQQLTNTTTAAWGNVVFSSLSLTQTQLDGLRIKYTNTKTGVGSSQSSAIFSTYASITYTHVNDTPTISNISLNSGGDIVLTESTSTIMYATSTVSDADGYQDIQSVSAKIYRSGVTSSESCTPDDNNCYAVECSLSNCSGNSCTASCPIAFTYFADPTDSGTPWSGEYWRAWMRVVDQQNASASGYSPTNGPDVQCLVAVDGPADISFGTLNPGQHHDPLVTTSTIYATGNCSVDLTMYGTNMVHTSSSQFTIDVSKQRYTLTTSSVSFASSTGLTGFPGTALDVNIQKNTDPVTLQSTIVIWGMDVPLGTRTGNYSATTTFLGVINSLPW